MIKEQKQGNQVAFLISSGLLLPTTHYQLPTKDTPAGFYREYSLK